MRAQVAPSPYIPSTFFDNSGRVCSGCLLYTYNANTTTPLITYQDAAGTVPNSDPIVLNAAGRATIFLTSAAYTLLLTDRFNATIWSIDGVTASDLSILAANNVWTGTNTWQSTSTFNGPTNFNVGFTSLGPNTLGGGGSINGTWSGSPILSGTWNFQEIDFVNGVYSGQLFSTMATGSPPFVITSTTEVPNLNVGLLQGGTWGAPGNIGTTTPNNGVFTGLTANTFVLGGNGPATGYIGLDTKLVTGVALGGAVGSTVCKDSNGGITTSGCAGGFTQVETASAVGCTTQGTSFSNCDVVLTWPNAFADAGYIPVCSVKDTNLQASGGDGSTGDVPNAPIRSFNASTITVALTTLAGRAISGAANATIYCHGIHP
jgi:hypothetical protein